MAQCQQPQPVLDTADDHTARKATRPSYLAPHVQVKIMSHKVEEDYTKHMEQAKHERSKDQLLQALDKIRAPICVCEIVQADTKILFANHTWTTLAGLPRSPACSMRLDRRPSLAEMAVRLGNMDG